VGRCRQTPTVWPRLSGDWAMRRSVIESMNGARFVHDRLELAGWEVRIADAVVRPGPGVDLVSTWEVPPAGIEPAHAV
jgi:hypothetical protein